MFAKRAGDLIIGAPCIAAGTVDRMDDETVDLDVFREAFAKLPERISLIIADLLAIQFGNLARFLFVEAERNGEA
ncbi:hypothetical protein SDC9_197392 [bioreactor metagenome]|uniref:Uncharacterized protein n=1 Tax=bioreactor metagenome TaxID=1076179 RepID=A0A645IF81_9ZZZZ